MAYRKTSATTNESYKDKYLAVNSQMKKRKPKQSGSQSATLKLSNGSVIFFGSIPESGQLRGGPHGFQSEIDSIE